MDYVDVKESERVDRDFLLTRQGSDDPEWVEKKLRKMAQATCARAVNWSSERTKWHQCTHGTAEGEKYCYLHGGKRKPRPVYQPKDPRAIQERRLEQLRGKLKRLESAVGETRKQITELEGKMSQ